MSVLSSVLPRPISPWKHPITCLIRATLYGPFLLLLLCRYLTSDLPDFPTDPLLLITYNKLRRLPHTFSLNLPQLPYQKS